ncbi:MAG: amino acid adenylation domain-containing protein, partial [Micropruina sp.]|uniref:amino acid adenylation domain-containing protein n=1 Tax=Micropruina sp. TaxID=2737536 RepID=UPI0039E4356A
MTPATVPMTAPQQGIYFEYLRQPSPDYHLVLDLGIEPGLGAGMPRALEQVVREQPALRAMVFHDHDGGHYRIADDVAIPVRTQDLRGNPGAVEGIAELLSSEPFDLRSGPLWRVALCHLDEEDRLVLACHHLIADGQSLSLLAGRLVALAAEEQSTDEPADQAEQPVAATPVDPVTPVDPGFLDYQRRRTTPPSERRAARRRAHWEASLAGQEAPDLAHWMRPARSDPVDLRELGEELRLPVPQHLRDLIRATAQAAEVSEYAMYLSGFGLLLARYADAEQVCVVVPFADRPGLEQEESVGCFLHALPVRIDAQPDRSVRDVLGRTARSILQSWKYLDHPVYAMLHDYPALQGVYDITFIQDSYPALPAGVRGVHHQARVPFAGRFSVLMEHLGDRAELVFQYKPSALTEVQVRRFAQRYLDLLSRLPESLDRTVAELSAMPEAETRQLRAELADTHHADWDPAHLGTLFLDKTSAEPAGPAWCDERREYSNAWAHDAAVLVQRRIINATERRTPVAVQLPRTAGLLAAVFGTVIAGRAYVPIPEGIPARRLEQILADVGAEVFLTTSDSEVVLPRGVRRLDLDRWDEFAALRDDDRVAIREHPADAGRLSADDVLYVEYTSGSTGVPKGVVILHRNIQNTALDLERRFPLRAGDVFLLKTSFTFDIFGTEIYGWLFGAGTLAILPAVKQGDVLAVLEAIENWGITHVNFAPTMLRVLLDAVRTGSRRTALAGLRHIFCGGEAVTRDIVEQFFALDLGCSLENVYGPTEASMWATCGTVTAQDETAIAPIGRPLNDYRVYVLGAGDVLLGPDLPGEICVAGAGVAVGYLNRDELNARHFVDNPFYRPAVDADHQRRMYRTGDRGFLREDGRFAFLRRMDRQVKIGGVRIELGEVEQALHGVDEVVEAAAVVQDTPAGARLVAFFTAARTVPADRLRAALGAVLMKSHLPSLFVQLEKLPTSAAGKLDRRALLALLAERDEQPPDDAAATRPATQPGPGARGAA